MTKSSDVKWLSPCKNDKLSGNRYYDQCKVGDISICIGNFVLVNNTRQPKSLSNAYLAKVIEMFESAGPRANKCRAVVQWYWWKAELPKAARRMIKSDCEVFLNLKNYDNVIDLETILDVVKVNECLDGYAPTTTSASGLNYVCRAFDGHTFQSLPVLPSSIETAQVNTPTSRFGRPIKSIFPDESSILPEVSKSSGCKVVKNGKSERSSSKNAGASSTLKVDNVRMQSKSCMPEVPASTSKTLTDDTASKCERTRYRYRGQQVVDLLLGVDDSSSEESSSDEFQSKGKSCSTTVLTSIGNSFEIEHDASKTGAGSEDVGRPLPRRIRRALYHEPREANSADSYGVSKTNRKRQLSPDIKTEDTVSVKKRRVDRASHRFVANDVDGIASENLVGCRSSPHKVQSMVLEIHEGDWKVSTPTSGRSKPSMHCYGVVPESNGVSVTPSKANTPLKAVRVGGGGLTPILRDPKSDHKITPSKSVTFQKNISSSPAVETPLSKRQLLTAAVLSSEKDVNETRLRRRSLAMEKLEEVDENENTVSNKARSLVNLQTPNGKKTPEKCTPERKKKSSATPESSSAKKSTKGSGKRKSFQSIHDIEIGDECHGSEKRECSATPVSTTRSGGRKRVETSQAAKDGRILKPRTQKSHKKKKFIFSDSENSEVSTDVDDSADDEENSRVGKVSGKSSTPKSREQSTPTSAKRHSMRRKIEIMTEVSKSVPGTGRILRPRTPKSYKMKLSIVSESESSDNSFQTEEESSSSEQDSEDEADESSAARRTRKSCKTSRSRSSQPNTPNQKFSKKNPIKRKDFTPSMPERLRRVLGANATALEQARARLHVSALPDSLPCRDEEFADVYQFVRAKIVDSTGGCMYISGVPGTGKTATVRQVVTTLREEYDAGELPYFKFIEINGMRLTEPHQIYVQILSQLTGQKASASQAVSILEKWFSTPDPRRDPVLLLVDELDMLWTKKQTVMYNVFDWPTKRHARLTVVAVANTMDLPERMLMSRVASRLGMTRMTFEPYTYRQLQEIVLSRIKGLPVFDEDAVQLVARKVAALFGDARRALDICRRATELVDQSTNDRGIVKMTHVDAALQEMYSAPKIVAVRNASLHEKLFLRAILAEFGRTGIEEAVFRSLYKQHVSLCRLEGVNPSTVSQASSICSRLSSIRLLIAEGGRADLRQRISLNISQEDVLFALRAVPVSKS